MMTECISAGQSARSLDVVGDVEELRAALRALGRDRHVHIRTALLDDVVVVARTDAQLWDDDTTVMRRKLTPPR